MTKHDELRQILASSGFKFNNGQTAFDMTDEEVEKFVFEFISHMAKVGQQFATILNNAIVAMVAAIEPYRENMEKILIEAEKNKQ
jgi:hypothetical protein